MVRNIVVRYWKILVGVMIISVGVSATPPADTGIVRTPDRLNAVLATVNGEPISLGDILPMTRAREYQAAAAYSGDELTKAVYDLRLEAVDEVIDSKLIVADYSGKSFEIPEREVEAAVDEAEQNLSADLETAVAVRDNSVQALESALASVRSAKENLDTAQEQLTVGSVSRIELSDAIASYSSALGDSIVAFYAGQRAEAALFALVGRFPVYSEATVRGGGDEE